MPLDVDEMKQRLLERREQLLVHHGSSMRRVEHSADEMSADHLDQASASSEFDIAVNTAFLEGEELEAVDAALRRIDGGTYGRCEDCGCQIVAKRLEALPYARLCVECQRSFEEHGGYARSAYDDGHAGDGRP